MNTFHLLFFALVLEEVPPLDLFHARRYRFNIAIGPTIKIGVVINAARKGCGQTKVDQLPLGQFA